MFSYITNDREFERKMNEKMARIKFELDRVLFMGAEKMVTDAVRLAPKHDGELIQSIDSKPQHLGEYHLQYIVYANADHAAHVEFGTRPHFPPPQELKKWAKDKLGDEKLAYVVAKSIARRGTRAQPFFRPAFNNNKDWVQRNADLAIKRALRS